MNVLVFTSNDFVFFPEYPVILLNKVFCVSFLIPAKDAFVFTGN